jgi:hypothetical protein
MAVDLELLTFSDGQSSQATENISEAISDAILRTMGALAENRRRKAWVEECQTRVMAAFGYEFHLYIFLPEFHIIVTSLRL